MEDYSLSFNSLLFSIPLCILGRIDFIVAKRMIVVYFFLWQLHYCHLPKAMQNGCSSFSMHIAACIIKFRWVLFHVTDRFLYFFFQVNDVVFWWPKVFFFFKVFCSLMAVRVNHAYFLGNTAVHEETAFIYARISSLIHFLLKSIAISLSFLASILKIERQRRHHCWLLICPIVRVWLHVLLSLR